MKDANLSESFQAFVRGACVVAAALSLMIGTSGCLAVGYSSGGGWFVWPGGLGLVVLILIVLFFMRRRR